MPKPTPPSVESHYDSVAADYASHYDRNNILDVTRPYPANYFRLQLLLNSFVQKSLRRVIEVGVGEGTPLATLAQAGIDVWGFDLSPQMVEKSKQTLNKIGADPSHIVWGDIQDPTSYAPLMKGGLFDGLMAMGVLPHVENDDRVLRNMAALVRPGGTVFIEFRNKLFSLFTFNRHTHEFILDDLLKDVAPSLREAVAQELRKNLQMNQPPPRDKMANSSAPGYDAILAKFHNPFEVLEHFKRLGFQNAHLLWYHYHAAPPYLEPANPLLFRQEAIRLEQEASGWRGMFLCSAFVVEAVKGDTPPL